MANVPRVRTLGQTRIPLSVMQAFCDRHQAHERFRNTIVPLFYEHASQYNLPAENVVLQSWKETNRGHYTGVVSHTFHNTGGIKTRAGGGNFDPEAHQRFASWRDGVQAHCSHLAKYGGLAEADMPAGHTRSPRLVHITTGSAPDLRDLGGKYAPSPTYGVEIEQLVSLALSFMAEQGGNGMTDIPGVAWVPADARHHTKGRSVAWPDLLVQHHTDGTDSLDWLTVNPASNVSSHYLTFHSGVVRAQLVRHRDTAHTNLHFNPRTLTVEWERRWTTNRQMGNAVTDAVYRNLAELWVGIIEAERRRGNPNFQSALRRNQIVGHNDLLNSFCPGNLDVGRLYTEIAKLQEAAVTPPKPEQPHNRYFPQTGFYTSHGFYGFWRDNGGIAIFGMPVSREFDWHDERRDRTITVQWYERARFEYQPDIAQNKHGVVLGLIGSELRHADRERYPDAFEPEDPPGSG